MIMVITTNSLAHVKARLSAYVDAVEATHERVVITRNGTPAAILISPDDLASLEETVMLLSDPEAMTEIAEARAAIAARHDAASTGSSTKSVKQSSL
ncbi:MAG: type II toxin-antitoxin system Phd/YefM family antitoxin [Actinobacteria bacterium]|nr:type II toxin-antitoxin system Phd/YefM family antitoxin [Actinomycetota bacterium]